MTNLHPNFHLPSSSSISCPIQSRMLSCAGTLPGPSGCGVGGATETGRGQVSSLTWMMTTGRPASRPVRSEGPEAPSAGGHNEARTASSSNKKGGDKCP